MDKNNWRDIVNEYHEIYCKHYDGGKVYGKSSEDLLDLLAPHIIEINPKSILDYGCGRSCLINYFWNDGKRKLYKFDPAIREYRKPHRTPVDLVICTDVLEHIPMNMIPTVLERIKGISKKIIFSVSVIPARQKLSDGSNAHITIRTKDKWLQMIGDFISKEITIIKEEESGIIFKTWKN